MVLPEELASPAVVETSAPLGLQDLVLLVPLVTKDKQAFQEALGPLVCLVQRVKQEQLFLYLALLEQQDFQGPLDSQGLKVTEASLEPQDDQASQEKKVLWVSQGLDFLGLLAPKVLMACLGTWDLLGFQAALDLMAYLATQECKGKRESLALGCQDSKGSQVFQAFLAHLERRAASGDQVFLENMG